MELEFSYIIFSRGFGIGLMVWALSSGLSKVWSFFQFSTNP